MVKEADSDGGPLRMVLNRDDVGFGAQKAVVTFDEDAVGKFEWMVDYKQHFAARAELDDGVLKKDILAGVRTGVDLVVAMAVAGSVVAVTVVAVAVITTTHGAAEFDRNPHRRGVGKESRQAVDDIKFWSASRCLVGHYNLNPGGVEQSSLPAFLVWKSCEETPILLYRCFTVHGLRQKREGHGPLSNRKKETELTDVSHEEVADAHAIRENLVSE